MIIAAVVLAAGASSRLGEPKQLLLGATGETLVHEAAREALAAGAKPVIVVVGASSMLITSALFDLDVQISDNVNWQEGLASSIRCGVQVAEHCDADVHAVMLLTCDMPAVGETHLRSLLSAFETGATRVASAYGGTVGVPAIIPRSEFSDLLQLTGDKGAKPLLLRAGTIAVPLQHGTSDLDTPANVAAWRAGFKS